MSLKPLVELYRLAGHPSTQGDEFQAVLDFSVAADVVKHAREAGADFRDLLVDGCDVGEDDAFPNAGGEIEFRVWTPQDSSSTFHADLSALLERDVGISRGEIPSDYYLIEEDFYSEEGHPPKGVCTLQCLVQLIGALYQLADYRDDKRGTPILVFLLPNERSPGTTVELDTRINSKILDLARPLTDELIADVVQLANAEPSSDTHYNAKRGVFGTSIAEFISTRPKERLAFAYLVEHWKEFSRIYKNNVYTYISGFAFHKAKQEVAEAELDIASQFSQVVTGIAGKLLSVPVSMVAVVAMTRVDNLIEKGVILLGIAIVSILLFGAVRNQRRQFERIKHAKTLVLRAIEGKQEHYPSDLRNEIENMTTGLHRAETGLGCWLWFYLALCWIPFIAGLLILGVDYWPSIIAALEASLLQSD